MNLTTSYNLKKDIQNWQESIEKSNYNVNWIKFLPENISLDCARSNACLENYLNINYPENKILNFINSLNNLVNAEQIQNDLEDLLNAKFTADDFKIFITTFHRAPYNVERNYFYLICRENNAKKAVSGIYHELMHFLFHQNYWGYCESKGLDDEKIHILKESLTILLNKILEKRGLPLDKGYMAHQELREKIKNCQKNSKNFKKLLEEIIKLL